MKVIIRLLFAGVILLFAAAGAASQTCPPPGTEVPFAKVINEAFAHDYYGCDIVVKAEFFASGSAPFPWGNTKGITGKVPFRVVAPGEHVDSGAFYLPPHAFLQKEKADAVFSLKKGDLIILRGAPAAGPTFGRGTPIPGYPPVFIATDLILADAPDAVIKQMIQAKAVAATVVSEPAGPPAIAGIPDVQMVSVYGVYYRTPDGKWTTLSQLVPSGHESRGFVSKGFATYRGAEAAVRISDRRPVIFIQSIGQLNASGWHFLQLGKKRDHRELQVSQETALGGKSGSSISDKDIRDGVVQRVTDKVSSLTPASDLPDGEYVVTDGLYYYDFGIGK